ncbi:hypothetical protein BpHYR1_039393 [Brachionus plicatilis]|uniref:Retrotransposon gag domain-containing protein n=1 Tax=Brachionus plicatilis TaxID=10195 RepID=A0A3M7SUP0_BRAPC|nr:hypothetical protein BpHYR1_039393 [Brachionus plicatilis]
MPKSKSSPKLTANKSGAETREHQTQRAAKRTSKCAKPRGRPPKIARLDKEPEKQEDPSATQDMSISHHSKIPQPSHVRAPPSISIRVFNGSPDEDLEQWIAEFKIKLYGVADEQFKIEALKAYTSGRARELLNSFNSDLFVSNSFEKLLDELRKTFLPQTPTHYLKILANTRRSPNEPLDHFTIRVGELVHKAFPTNDSNILDRMKMEYFINGLSADEELYANQYEGEKMARRKDFKEPKEAKPIALAAGSDAVSGEGQENKPKEKDNDNEKGPGRPKKIAIREEAFEEDVDVEETVLRTRLQLLRTLLKFSTFKLSIFNNHKIISLDYKIGQYLIYLSRSKTETNALD